MDVEVSPSLTIPAQELAWKFSRSSGPGGQHVNTSDSRVQLTWNLAESDALTDEQRALLLAGLARVVAGSVTVTVSQQRSQLRNRETAIETLAAIVRQALAPAAPPRRPTRPTRGSTRRRLVAKQQRAATKQQRRTPRAD